VALLDLLFDTDCAGCGRPGGLTCAGCIAALRGPAVPAWPRPAPAGLPPPWAVAAYVDPARTLLLAYKERDAIGLRAVLAVALATSVLAALPAADGDQARAVLVPVPSTGRAVRARGDDVVLGLTRTAAAILRRSGAHVHVVGALRHSRTVADSAGLTAASRAANLADAFIVRRGAQGAVAGAVVIITEDLITTGASLAESARALRAAGARVVGAATVAATQRRDSAP
jgi:predicted amidophosphoribosyltransferase